MRKSAKVREHSVAKVPYIIAVGGREAESNSVALRRLGSDKQETLALSEAVNTLGKEILPPDLARQVAE
jgi:threonyl-tRNA synthetase